MIPPQQQQETGTMPAIICNQGQPPELSAKDHQAIAKGFTKRVYIEGGCEGGSFLIRPEDDHDGRFKAWAIDWEEWTWVNGCTVSMEAEDEA
jgi:hypothetical protein